MIYLKIEMFFIAILFFVVGFYFRKIFLEKSLNSAKNEAKKILDQAKEIAETTKKEIILEGKEKAHKFRENLEREMAERRKEIQFQERRARQREELVDRKFESAENKEIASEKKLKKINEKAEEIEKIRLNQISKLEKISNLTVEQAKKYMLELLDSDLVQEKAKKISDFNQNIENKKEEIAKNVLSCAVQKYASDYVIETTVSVVNLPNDEMKGRIIGREGRNIRSIETLTGVDLIIDDTPEAIAISSFDPLRREIAKVALELLIMDGRIHPAKIEE
ncbi:MAG: Rnase Y domain-containing protein, partial [Firmicutes bacterium]|nr:Rnase Y domain-containing protein [Bacillota bacterium]